MDWDSYRKDLSREQKANFYNGFHAWMESAVKGAKKEGRDKVTINEIERGLEIAREIAKK